MAVDGDVFDQTNLNRQLFCNESDLGKSKAKEAKKRIKKVNSSVNFIAFTSRFSEIPQKIWNDVGLVFDCLDNIKDRIILVGKVFAGQYPACSRGNCRLVRRGGNSLAGQPLDGANL